MKKSLYLFFVLILNFSFATEEKDIIYNASFFDGKNYQLEYFLKNGIQEELDLNNPNDPSGNTFRGTPSIGFQFDAETNTLQAAIVGYCNETTVSYNTSETSFNAIARGATTLSDCGGDEESEYFAVLSGNIYLQNPAKEIFHEITEDEKGLWLWTDENHKLYFSATTLNTKENSLSNTIKVFPNPADDVIYLNYANNIILDVSVIDIEGKEVLRQTDNFEKIDISKLPSNYYLLKIKTSLKNTITKKIIKK